MWLTSLPSATSARWLLNTCQGIPFLRSQNVEPLRVNQEDIKFITPEFHERIRKSALAPGDVVIGRHWQAGRCTVMPDWLPISNCSACDCRCART